MKLGSFFVVALAFSQLGLAQGAEAPAWPASAASSALVFKDESAAALPGLSQWLMALLLCALLLAGLLWGLRRRWPSAALPGRVQAARQLQLLERLPLSAGTQLVAVRDGERRLLILLGPSGAQVLPDASTQADVRERGDAQ